MIDINPLFIVVFSLTRILISKLVAVNPQYFAKQRLKNKEIFRKFPLFLKGYVSQIRDEDFFSECFLSVLSQNTDSSIDTQKISGSRLYNFISKRPIRESDEV